MIYYFVSLLQCFIKVSIFYGALELAMYLLYYVCHSCTHSNTVGIAYKLLVIKYEVNAHFFFNR